MNCAIVAFSPEGVQLGLRLKGRFCCQLFAPDQYARDGMHPMDGGLRTWTADAFHRHDALVFIGAIGIAVRAIAPHVRSKTSDPAVVVMDELGQHVIPILSGHIGGANKLATEIAHWTGAMPVITTATDLHGLPAIDAWAAEQGIAIENPEAIAPVSAAALAGREVAVMITEREIAPPFPVTLILRPRTLTVGVGCKRGAEPKQLERCLMDFLKLCGVSLLSVCALASIDRKADELGLLWLSEKYKLPLVTYIAEALRALPGTFASSDWVQRTVGVDNVCERAAVLHAGGRLLVGKTIYEGATFALATWEDNL